MNLLSFCFPETLNFLQEIEERAPLLYQQKKSYEEGLISIESLKSKLNDAVKVGMMYN